MSIEGLFELGKDITVSSPEHQEKPSVRPAHHLNDQGTKFTNPWVSWRCELYVQCQKYLLMILGCRGPQMSSVFKVRAPHLTCNASRLHAADYHRHDFQWTRRPLKYNFLDTRHYTELGLGAKQRVNKSYLARVRALFMSDTSSILIGNV